MVNVCKSLSLPEDRSGRCSSEGQGIRVVLEKQSLAGSLRRTLSANMSACPSPSALLLRRSASCEHFLGLSSNQEQEQEHEHNQNEDQEQEQDFWSLVHNEQSPPPPSDAFSALVALKEGGDGSQSPFETYKKPYIHPNVKRRYKLSDKSLQLCTEGLGSETGSDCSLSDYRFSASSDEEDDEEAEEEEEQQNNRHSMGADSDYNGLIISSGVSKRSEYLHVCDGSLSAQNSGNAVATSSLPHGSRNKPSRCFPPPLPSLSKANGSSVTMKSVKQDGRFMLKAVTVSASQKCLRAHRQQGRLQLHFVASLSLQNDVNIAAHPAVAEAEAETEVEKCAKRDRCDEDADEVTSSSPDIRQYNNGKSQGDIPLLNKHVPDCRYRPPSASVPVPADADANHSLKFKHGDLINSSIIDVGCKNKRIQQQEAAKSKEGPSARASSGSSALNVYVGWRSAAAAGSTYMFGYAAYLLGIYSDNKKSDSPVRLNECAHSLPDFSVHKPSFGVSRCKDRRKMPSNFKPYSVAIS